MNDNDILRSLGRIEEYMRHANTERDEIRNEVKALSEKIGNGSVFQALADERLDHSAVRFLGIETEMNALLDRLSKLEKTHIQIKAIIGISAWFGGVIATAISGTIGIVYTNWGWIKSHL